MAQCRLDQRCRGRFAVFLLQVLLQGTGVDADTDGDTTVTGGVDHRTHAVLATDVARVDAQTVDAQFGHTQRNAIVEVDVGDERHADLLLDAAERLGGVHVRYRNANDVDAGIDQALDLRDRGSDVIGVGVGHALHRDGASPPTGTLPTQIFRDSRRLIGDSPCMVTVPTSGERSRHW